MCGAAIRTQSIGTEVPPTVAAVSGSPHVGATRDATAGRPIAS
ncbi:DUF6053 domain-containing protein [Lysobacter enzymogenes]